jgi:hypothetical protein
MFEFSDAVLTISVRRSKLSFGGKSHMDEGLVLAAEGYVVVGLDGRYLSRSMKWVRHADRTLGGVHLFGERRAWVHTSQTLKAGGEWSSNAKVALPAAFDPHANFTVITGGPIPIEEVS